MHDDYVDAYENDTECIADASVADHDEIRSTLLKNTVCKNCLNCAFKLLCQCASIDSVHGHIWDLQVFDKWEYNTSEVLL